MAELLTQYRTVMFFLLTTGVNLVMGWLAWRAEERAGKLARILTSEQGVADERLKTIDAQAAELKKLNHRNRFLANQLRCDDTSKTRAWPNAKPEVWQP